MSPFWWIHGTLPHITVMVDDVTPTTLTEEGPADGAENETVISCCIKTLKKHVPTGLVVTTVSLLPIIRPS